MSENTGTFRLVWLPVIVGGGLFLLLNIWGLMLNGGVFVYPIDDTYIHLSMAEQLVRFQYGINPGEFAAADSSILYPVLLMPFSGTGLHPFVPLFWNGLALVWAMVVLEKIFRESGFFVLRATRLMAIIAMVAMPLALNIVGIALLGMEQMLHILMVLFALLGVVRWQASKRLNFYLIAAIIVGPLVRFEATGLSLLLALMVLWEGKRLAGIGLTLAAVLPLIGFSSFLYLADGHLLPNSVLRKVSLAQLDDASLVLHNFSGGTEALIAWLFVALAALFAALFLFPELRRDGLSFRVGLMAIAALLGHVVFGRNGWGNRYESYIIVFAIIALWVFLMPLLQNSGAKRGAAMVVALAVLALPLKHFAIQSITFGPFSMNSVYAQQMQMGRFARDYVQAPVIVNDIGLPSFQNENQVVDLWGLASAEALAAWATQAPRGWPNRMADEAGADLAMNYENWIRPAMAPGWTTLGYLTLLRPSYAVAGRRVTFYATNPQSVDRLQSLMRGFQPTLPDMVVMEILTPPEPYFPQTEG